MCYYYIIMLLNCDVPPFFIFPLHPSTITMVELTYLYIYECNMYHYNFNKTSIFSGHRPCVWDPNKQSSLSHRIRTTSGKLFEYFTFFYHSKYWRHRKTLKLFALLSISEQFFYKKWSIKKGSFFHVLLNCKHNGNRFNGTKQSFLQVLLLFFISGLFLTS